MNLANFQQMQKLFPMLHPADRMFFMGEHSYWFCIVIANLWFVAGAVSENNRGAFFVGLTWIVFGFIMNRLYISRLEKFESIRDEAVQKIAAEQEARNRDAG